MHPAIHTLLKAHTPTDNSTHNGCPHLDASQNSSPTHPKSRYILGRVVCCHVCVMAQRSLIPTLGVPQTKSRSPWIKHHLIRERSEPKGWECPLFPPPSAPVFLTPQALALGRVVRTYRRAFLVPALRPSVETLEKLLSGPGPSTSEEVT